MPELFPFYQSFLETPFLGATIQVWLVFMVVVVVATAFIKEWASPDVVALCALGAAFVTVLDTNDLLAVFSNRAPITIACMFVLSAALERTGAIDVMGNLFQRVAGKTELRVMLSLMGTAAVLSAFINNTPVVVVFLPIVKGLARSLGLKASRLLIPLSFASILGGTCTLTGTSTNLIIDNLAQQQGLERFGMFELTKIGLLYAIIGAAYLATIGRKLLPKRDTLGGELDPPERRHFLTQFSVEGDSPLIGKTLPETLLREIPEADVLEVRRRGRVMQTPLNELKIRQNDRLLITLYSTSVDELRDTDGIRFDQYRSLNLREMETRELKLMEGIIGPNSQLHGKTLREFQFRQRFGVHVLAIHRRGQDLRKRADFGDVKLRFGDTLLMEGPVDRINELQKGNDFVSITESKGRVQQTNGIWVAAALTLGFVLGATIWPEAIPAFAIMAALGLIVSRCIAAEDAYRSVQWSIVFLIFGMLGLGKAMEVSGAAQFLAEGISSLFGWASPFIILSVVYLLSSVLTELISNNAVAALLTPVIIEMARTLEWQGTVGVDPRPFVVALMLGCSASFATPIGYQTNTYVYGAGGYRFSDFPKVGIPLNLLLWLVATFLVPVFWGFR